MQLKYDNSDELSYRDIARILGEEDTTLHQRNIRLKNGEYRAKRLYSDLIVPSSIHGYSLAIEFMRQWFIRTGHFENFFKTIYVNGKHVLDDFRYFNRDIVKKQKPMLAILPTIEYDHNRENVDLYVGDPSIFLRRSNFQQAFFKDRERQQYLGVQFKELKMRFGFRIRVATKAQQEDLRNVMELRYRIGATQSQYISADFHIPRNIMISIAESAGFEVDKNNMMIKDIMAFLAYFNSHSELPVMFKMREINQQYEFFMRVRSLHIHIVSSEKLDPDEGERDGQLETNFHLDTSFYMTMPVPHFYVYYAQEDLRGNTILHDECKDSIGLYTFNAFEIPEENELGWHQLILTSYLCEKEEKYADLSELFTGSTSLHEVMDNCLKNFISPQSFIDVRAYRNSDNACIVHVKMDFESRKLLFLEDMDDEAINIVVYADRQYINETTISLNNYNNTRLTLEQSIQQGNL